MGGGGSPEDHKQWEEDHSREDPLNEILDPLGPAVDGDRQDVIHVVVDPEWTTATGGIHPATDGDWSMIYCIDIDVGMGVTVIISDSEINCSC